MSPSPQGSPFTFWGSPSASHSLMAHPNLQCSLAYLCCQHCPKEQAGKGNPPNTVQAQPRSDSHSGSGSNRQAPLPCLLLGTAPTSTSKLGAPRGVISGGSRRLSLIQGCGGGVWPNLDWWGGLGECGPNLEGWQTLSGWQESAGTQSRQAVASMPNGALAAPGSQQSEPPTLLLRAGELDRHSLYLACNLLTPAH